MKTPLPLMKDKVVALEQMSSRLTVYKPNHNQYGAPVPSLFYGCANPRRSARVCAVEMVNLGGWAWFRKLWLGLVVVSHGFAGFAVRYSGVCMS